jgi:hypothetical protein
MSSYGTTKGSSHGGLLLIAIMLGLGISSRGEGLTKKGPMFV